MSDFLSRVASAPISWGICEVPGWGAMLPTPRVLSEMSGLGLTATELGAPGFLPTDPDDVKAELAGYGMTLLGGFTPVVLHDPAQRQATIQSATATARLSPPPRSHDSLRSCGCSPSTALVSVRMVPDVTALAALPFWSVAVRTHW